MAQSCLQDQTLMIRMYLYVCDKLMTIHFVVF